MEIDKDIVIENFLGIHCELNIKERKLVARYQDKKALKNIGQVIKFLTQKSNLNALEIASFSLYIEHDQNNNKN